MKIGGKVHCFFEQSGTFKNEFIMLGIPAEDYDIQDNFGQTDHVIDLFENIQKAYEGGASVFDNIKQDDLILAFFPCIYFCSMSQIAFNLGYINYRSLSDAEKVDQIIERSKLRQQFYEILLMFCAVCMRKKLRMVFENPWSEQTFLKANFLKAPDIVDMDRSRRGDFRIKPTAYWFFNCEAEHGFTYQPYEGKILTHQEMKPSGKRGICSEERSLISPDYARNFICDFILGKKQEIGQLSLF